MNEEERDEKFYHFGPMLVKERPKLNMLASNGWNSTFASSEEESEEVFHNSWPSLTIVDGRKPKKATFSYESIVKNLRKASEEDGMAIFVLFDKLSDEKIERELTRLGVTKLLKWNPKQFANELHWFERAILPLQSRLRATSGLFSALEHCDNPVEISDADKTVQLVNNAYEVQTGAMRNAVLGNPSALFSDASAQAASESMKLCLDESNKPADFLSSGWRCLDVPGPSSQCNSQYVNIKQPMSIMEGSKLIFNGVHQHRNSSVPRNNSSVDTPVSEILSLLKDVQNKCENDNDVQVPIQKAVKILNSTDLYSPLITRFKREDKVASNLFGGLILNGPIALIQKNRKASLSETMRSEKSQRQTAGLLRRLSPDIVAILKTEDGWNFNIFDLERMTLRKPLTYLGMKIFQRWKVREFLQCTETCLNSWLEIVESHYHNDNPYHNSTHAADVLHATAYYLGKEKIANMLEHSDAVAALLAAVIHDVDHPGRGSSFLINSKHPLALLYNDVSVLENHHAALGFQLTTSDPRLNIFSKLSPNEYSAMRKRIVDMVLATDMNRHFEYLAKFQTTILANETEPAPENAHDRIDPRRIVCRILIKCADVSNPTRPWHICKEWGYRIVEEYFAQTAEERAKELPLTMEVFDRDTCNVPVTQCSFMDMFIREMFQGWCNFVDMPELMAFIEENYVHWQEEEKTWPKQRNEEYAKIQKYLAMHQPENGPTKQWSRLSFETTAVYGQLSNTAAVVAQTYADEEATEEDDVHLTIA